MVIPYGHTHPSKGKTIAFLGDPTPDYGVPPIVWLDMKDFDDAKPWFHPELASLSEAHARQGQVLPIPKTVAMVDSPKIIPIPLFLVPFFMQGGKPKLAIDTLNNYQQKFLVNATPELAENTRHILHFLLAATGYDASQDTNTKPPTNQLAVKMEPLKFDPVLTHWATNQFAGLWQIARVYDTKHSNRNPTNQTQNNTNSRPKQRQQQHYHLGVDQQRVYPALTQQHSYLGEPLPTNNSGHPQQHHNVAGTKVRHRNQTTMEPIPKTTIQPAP